MLVETIKLLGTSASLLVTSALLVVTIKLLGTSAQSNPRCAHGVLLWGLFGWAETALDATDARFCVGSLHGLECIVHICYQAGVRL